MDFLVVALREGYPGCFYIQCFSHSLFSGNPARPLKKSKL
nr:MAG TPA: hypothetical protein [Caudoviricetes sp.]